MEDYGKQTGDYFIASGDDTIRRFETAEEANAAWMAEEDRFAFWGKLSDRIPVDKASREFFNSHCLDCETPAGYYCEPGCPSLAGQDPKEV